MILILFTFTTWLRRISWIWSTSQWLRLWNMIWNYVNLIFDLTVNDWLFVRIQSSYTFDMNDDTINEHVSKHDLEVHRWITERASYWLSDEITLKWYVLSPFRKSSEENIHQILSSTSNISKAKELHVTKEEDYDSRKNVSWSFTRLTAFQRLMMWYFKYDEMNFISNGMYDTPKSK